MTVHSKDGQSWLTKLQRLSELSAANRGLVFNNIGHLLNAELLRDVYQRLDGMKAVGIDGITKEEYGSKLEENLGNLLQRVRRGTYHPQPARISEIPKEDGSFRPLAISCLEDKLVQSAVSRILTAIYEPLFLPCSFGFRTGLGCHDALSTLHQTTFKWKDGAVVEIDIRKYFNSIPLGPLEEFLRKKINDKRLLGLLHVLITAPTVCGGLVIPHTSGCPQGSILSPVLANIYLHHVIDEWFQTIGRSHFRGNASEIRYADDMIFVFEKAADAERFFEVLPKRLAKFGLEMHVDKSQLIPSGNQAAQRALIRGKRLPTYKFLGFVCYWGKSRNGKFQRLKCKSRGDRLSKKLQGMRKFLWEERAGNTNYVLNRVIAIVRGWVNYHAISDNERQVNRFIYASKRILFKWFNRRGRKGCMNWSKFARLMDRIGYPKPPKVKSMFPPPKRA